MIGQTKRDYNLKYILAWEPSAANVTKNYSRRLPALKRFYRENKFSLLNSTYLNLEPQNQATNIPVGLPSSPIKILGISV